MTATADTVLARLRAAAATGAYTRLHVSMGALDTVRALPEYAPMLSGDTPSMIGYLYVDMRGYYVFRDPAITSGFVELSNDDCTLKQLVWIEDDAVPLAILYGDNGVVAAYPIDLATVRADLERRYPGCTFTDAFVAAYAEGSA